MKGMVGYMFLYNRSGKHYVKEIVRYFNICPQCKSEDIGKLFEDLDGFFALDKSDEQVISKMSRHYQLHKGNKYCTACLYHDFPDAFLERELVMCYPRIDFMDEIFRMRYVNYLKERFADLQKESLEFRLKASHNFENRLPFMIEKNENVSSQ